MAATGHIPPPDILVFNDLDADVPPTHHHLAELSHYLHHHGLQLITVPSPNPTLYDHCITRGVLPAVYGPRSRRFCTKRYKIEALRQYLRSLGATTADLLMGISTDEHKRAKQPTAKWTRHRWPLLDLNLSRDDCTAILTDAGFDIPPKSSCFFCPFQSKDRWLVVHQYPALFAAAVALERAAIQRRRELGKTPLYLSYRKRPLHQAWP